MQRFSTWLVRLGFLTCVVGFAASARADELNVAVAANFVSTLQKLSESFEKATGHKILASPGSSGQLYAQIKKGAPFDVLLSADAERPAQLESDGLGVKGTRFTYAIGRLVLWSPKPGFVDSEGKVLSKPDLRFVSLADPKTAPYGAAAEQVLTKLGLIAQLRAANKLVYGESVGQAHQFASSGHADCGFVALSQVLDSGGGKATGSMWTIPEAEYARLNQDAIVLSKSEKQPLAKQFLDFLHTNAAAIQIVKAAGYALPGTHK